MTKALLRIGTRGSPLALIQAELVRTALAERNPELRGAGAIEIVPIVTSGDRIQDRTLAEIGGKGLFTREIEDGLLSGDLDLAVHSMKDMPTAPPARLTIAAFLPRADPRDSLVAPGFQRISELPERAVVGTAALRRKAQLLHLRPDLVVVPFRGNVGTRLRKLQEGAATATILASAGLDRLGRSDAGSPIGIDEMLPAVGQGAICIECREDRAEILDVVRRIDHAETAACVRAEHALLAALDGSCRTPIAGHARIVDGRLDFAALVASEDGSSLWRDRGDTIPSDGPRFGREMGERLRRDAGERLFAG